MPAEGIQGDQKGFSDCKGSARQKAGPLRNEDGKLISCAPDSDNLTARAHPAPPHLIGVSALKSRLRSEVWLSVSEGVRIGPNTTLKLLVFTSVHTERFFAQSL